MSVERVACMLQEVAEEIAICQRCVLGATRTLTVPGEGPPRTDIMFVGEGPGEQEDRTGRPFVGAAGTLLNQLLLKAGLRRPELFITNLVKCRPPGNRAPTPDEVTACHPYLEAQIALVSPRVICLLGRPATQALLCTTEPISRIHGVPREQDGILYVPLYHPAAALHQPSLQPVLVEDMRRLRVLLESHGCPTGAGG